ncbi:hypothetical protein DR999_PMT22164 [Platysternon megacephalum]|uniref:Uncharacterized protein n=1 Tax=Platysternon megacephalum TaxID=55544 RepID=A0A4D9DFE7_9SAUR|nr:hypothetical protein DR999_PMT22164 [Platysternon megacephalum]
MQAGPGPGAAGGADPALAQRGHRALPAQPSAWTAAADGDGPSGQEHAQLQRWPLSSIPTGGGMLGTAGARRGWGWHLHTLTEVAISTCLLRVDQACGCPDAGVVVPPPASRVRKLSDLQPCSQNALDVGVGSDGAA